MSTMTTTPPDHDPSLMWDPAAALPRHLPTSLEALHGPGSGRLDPPVTAYWGPREPEGIDLDDDHQLIIAYSDIVANATTGQQQALLNRELLVRHWKSLFLDDEHVRRVWEKRFPELRETR